MKNTKSQNHAALKNQHIQIPELDIIDLEANSEEDMAEAQSMPAPRKKATALGILSHINVHIVLLVVFLLFIAGIGYRLANWGVEIDLNEIFKDGPGEYNDLFDVIVPLTTEDGQIIYPNYDDGVSILVFGNYPFADDRDSEDGLANMIQSMTDATLYNCSIGNSYLSSIKSEIDASQNPHDAFSFYRLCQLAVGDEFDSQYLQCVETMGDEAPAEAMEVYNTLKSVDMNTVDVITIMYDGSDYLAGRRMFDDDDPENIRYFTGNMVAGVKLLQENYPNIRIIVMSPTYAFGLQSDGSFISSDIKRYGQDVLSTYMIKQGYYCNVLGISFVDNLYGTIHEDNAREYLTDHIHLNIKGRKKVAERFVYALHYFDDMKPTE